MKKEPLLLLKQLSLKVPSRELPILSELSLGIYPGDFIVLLGSNGCGKSSLVKVINGLVSPTSGSLFFQGRSLSSDSLSARARSIVTLTQDLNLSVFSQMTILENCLIALYRNRRISFAVSVKEERKNIRNYLLEYNPRLADRLDEEASSLSGGERQTLALAMSAWNTPSLLLLDEHTSALDPVMTGKVMDVTSQITIERQITTVMTTHNLDHALSYGNRLIVMNQGKIALDVIGPDKNRLSRKALLELY